MSNTSEIPSVAIRAAIGNFTANAPVLAINAGGAATVKTTSAISYNIDGVFKSKTALAAQSIAVTHDFTGTPVASGVAAYVQPAGTTVYYALCVDAAGAITVVQGSYLGQSQAYASDPSKILTGKGGLPAEPANTTVFGLIKIVTGASTTFTPGTTVLDAAGVTATYFDVSRLPVTAP